MLATGTIDIGSMARGLAQIADDKGAGGGLETYLRLSSGLGLYSETLSRLVTALSARHLHGGYGADAQAFAAKTVSESMFDYQTWNTARQLGKKGMLGPVTPIVTQFMSYSTQLTEKLYSEFRDAVGSDPAKRKEAQRFLAGHLTAVTTLAGTLGLPFATAFAGALERLVDGFDDDDEPFDATAAYRNWLASVIGQDAAEVVARGAPRALGFDISQRTGEQNLFPSVLVNMLTDRRSWKDAASFQLSAGAVPSMATQVLDGGMQIADGNIAAGMKSILPTWLKAPTEVYRMAGEGYVDTKGNRLPMTPKASAYLWQLMGFSPAEKAEYGEARGDQSARRATLSKQAGALRRQIGDAILDKDHATARELLERAIQFDKDNPGFAMVSSIGPSLQRRMQERARSQALGTPLGVSMKDIAGQQLTGYANF